MAVPVDSHLVQNDAKPGIGKGAIDLHNAADAGRRNVEELIGRFEDLKVNGIAYHRARAEIDVAIEGGRTLLGDQFLVHIRIRDLRGLKLRNAWNLLGQRPVIDGAGLAAGSNNCGAVAPGFQQRPVERVAAGCRDVVGNATNALRQKCLAGACGRLVQLNQRLDARLSRSRVVRHQRLVCFDVRPNLCRA